MSVFQAWAVAALAATAISSAPDAQLQPLQAAADQSATDAWSSYKVRLIALARQQGVREATIQATIPGLLVNQTVVRLDHAEPHSASTGGPPSMAGYMRHHVTARLIARGQDRYAADRAWLGTIQARYGVDPAVLMAIYGHETSYGTVTGNLDLLGTLASLAYAGRRRELFEREFVAALKLMDQGVPRSTLRGSWAGATGYPQFLPTVALRLRADGDGDGYADIWRNEADGLASIASYLRDAGWKPGVAWGVAARVPSTLNRAALQSRVTAPKCPQVYRRHSRWLSVGQWRSLGVTPVNASLSNSEFATLLEPDGQTGTGYLLTNNYRAILDYNCSNFYAMSVGLLADAIARR